MLINLKEILNIAENKKCAIGAFNTPNLESIIAVVEVAEELNLPVIIMHAQIHEGIMPLHIIGPIMIDIASKSRVPVCVHLDHGETLDYLKKALDLGFTSIMYDGSSLSYEENVTNTRLAIDMATKYNASVEAEIGTLGKREMGVGHESESINLDDVYTNPDDAYSFIKETGIDALACSFGTAHGIYIKEPKIDFDLLDKVREKIDIPIVMHGGSGVSKKDYKRVMEKGVRKVNYFTYMSKAGGEYVVDRVNNLQNNRVIYYHEIVSWGIDAMKANIKQALKVFSYK